MEKSTEHIVFFLLRDFSHIAFSCAIEPLRIANLEAGAELYSWSLASENGVEETCSNGTITRVDGSFEEMQPRERLFIISGIHVEQHTTRTILDYVRATLSRGIRVGGICSAAYVLAKAGVLGGKQCAIHWEFHKMFAEMFPKVELKKTVFVPDETTPTASGGLAASDLMLHLITESHGSQLAVRVADQMVYNFVRSDEEIQGRTLHGQVGLHNRHLRTAIRLMDENQEYPLSSLEIAKKLGISTRQLERLFLKYVQCSPQQHYRMMRLESARNMLRLSDKPVYLIAIACGFESPSSFSKRYKATFGLSPNEERGTRI